MLRYVPLLAALVAPPAPAIETFTFVGSGTQTYDWWSCHCERAPTSFEWRGTVTWEVEGDGVFRDVGWSLTSLEWNVPHAFGDVTVEGGKVTYAFAMWPHMLMKTEGLSIYDQEHHGGLLTAQAVWAPVGHAPEPEVWTLMALGLALVAKRANARGGVGK